jgi:hypothetical protein
MRIAIPIDIAGAGSVGRSIAGGFTGAAQREHS